MKLNEHNKSARKSKNELLATSLGLSPSNLRDLVSRPMEVLVGLAEQRGFTEEEVNTLRDIRRRGKNLIAAHNCRNRKLGEVEVRSFEVFGYETAFTGAENQS